MKILELLNKYNMLYEPGTLTPNYIKLPKNFINCTVDGMNLFNELYKCILSEEYHEIVRTKSGGISISKENFKLPAYDVQTKKSGIEITLLTGAAMTRIIFSTILNRQDNKDTVTGTQAFRLLKRTLKKYNIDLEKYRISPEEGLKAKSEIVYKKQLVRPGFAGLTFENVHHADYNSSYPAGLVNTHPEFKEPIEFLYSKRHQNPVYKSILNNSISGYFQSPYVKYGFAGLCRDAILDNIKRVNELADELQQHGRMVISYNVDGIWYSGDIYHNENEGTELGQWKNDHINCKFCAKSAGSYEYEENGKIHVVSSGRMRLDRVKPRDEWDWNDLFNEDAEPIKFGFRQGEGIYEKNKECYN